MKIPAPGQGLPGEASQEGPASAGTEDVPLRPPPPLRLASILIWQVLASGALMAAAASLGQGSPGGVAAGGLVMSASMFFTRQALGFALRNHQRPLLGIGFFLLKLLLMLGLVFVGFYTDWLAPMSFAVGATTLPVAILMDACYPIGKRAAPPGSAPEAKE